MTKNHTLSRLARSNLEDINRDSTSKARKDIPYEEKSPKGDPHPAPKYTTSPRVSQESPLDQVAINFAVRLKEHIKNAMRTYAEDFKSTVSEFEVRECSDEEDPADLPTFGQTTGFNNAYDPNFRPRRLNPSIILTPESTVNSDDEDGYDDEDWKRYEKEITDSANNFNQSVSEEIEKGRKEYLAAAKKHYLKAKVESPEQAKEERERGIFVFKNLMGWVNSVFDKVTTLFRRFFREIFNNFETAMSWVAEQLARISYKHRAMLEYKANQI
ncbi:hypothetical protein TWF718_008308 [Orbilia javanica]|uniref:Uncharacterized protein n=1 Tax=Orbilia javanica TaxID=47235 RepID=A0AAN8N0U8_9PEZI